MPPPRAAKPRPSAVPARRSRAAPRAGLTRERIAGAALALVDDEGLPSLTARRLARALHCEAMSLYHHFASMDELLDAVADRLLAGIELPRPPAPTDLASTLRALSGGYLALAHAHPRAFPLVAARRLRTAAAERLLERVVALLAAHGLDDPAALRALRVLVAYLNGAGLALAAWRLDPGPAAAEPTGAVAARAMRSRSRAVDVGADLEAGVELLIAALCAPAPAR